MKCKLFYRMKKSGVYFTEGMPRGEEWVPYKIWSGDLWKCKGCGHEIMAGFGLRPVSEQHMERFKEIQERLRANEIQINDC